MKKIFFNPVIALLIIITCSIFYFSCDDAGIIQNEPPYVISGQINNWFYGSNLTVNAVISGPSSYKYTIASGSIDYDGNFSIPIPVEMPDSVLIEPDSILLKGCIGINTIFNPQDGKGVQINPFEVRSGDTVKGWIYQGSTEPLIGSHAVYYIYANKNITASGTRVCSSTLIFDAVLNKGWNQIVRTTTGADTTGFTFLFNNTVPAGSSWNYSGIWK